MMYFETTQLLLWKNIEQNYKCCNANLQITCCMLCNFQKLIIIDTARENHAALKMNHTL